MTNNLAQTNATDIKTPAGFQAQKSGALENKNIWMMVILVVVVTILLAGLVIAKIYHKRSRPAQNQIMPPNEDVIA